MATYKVDELEGQSLADAVALAAGFVSLHYLWRTPDGFEIDKAEWRPDENDAQGGRIIDRERIATMFLQGQWRAWMPTAGDMDGYDLEYCFFDQTVEQAHGSGPTRRVAAMRAFVKRRLNSDTVELP
jgi:hypothetical protein